jgi:hypothetical protein
MEDDYIYRLLSDIQSFLTDHPYSEIHITNHDGKLQVEFTKKSQYKPDNK